MRCTECSLVAQYVKTYALQVHVPPGYRGPEDQDQLGTIYLAYIPDDRVEELITQIGAKNSRFYTAVDDKVALELAQTVNSGYRLTSVADPNSSGDTGSGGLASTGAAASGKSRQDAIIGVVSALGAIAVFVLVFLVYRSLKKRRELAHRRLSDPPDMSGYRPEGREFDQDSLGGQRRRSFYYAEDSLRGFGDSGGGGGGQQQQYTYDHRTDPAVQQQQMRSRHVPVGQSAISAPILRESSMNW